MLCIGSYLFDILLRPCVLVGEVELALVNGLDETRVESQSISAKTRVADFTVDGIQIEDTNTDAVAGSGPVFV